jgi:hypothetical protein
MIYTAIYQANKIIADYSEDIGEFAQLNKKIFNANKQPIEFYVVPYLSYDYYFLHHANFTFSTITQPNQDNAKVMLFLQKLKASYLQLVIRKEKDNLLIKSVTIIRNLMIEFKEKLAENKFRKIDNKLESIINEKKCLLEATLEKDALLNNISEKSNNLQLDVSKMIYIYIMIYTYIGGYYKFQKQK